GQSSLSDWPASRRRGQGSWHDPRRVRCACLCPRRGQLFRRHSLRRRRVMHNLPLRAGTGSPRSVVHNSGKRIRCARVRRIQERTIAPAFIRNYPKCSRLQKQIGNLLGARFWLHRPPLRFELSPEPGHLPFRELPCPLFNQPYSLLERPFPAQVLDHLPITDCLHRRSVPRQAPFEQLLRLQHQAARKHLVHPRLDPRAPVLCPPPQAEETVRGPRSTFRIPRAWLRRPSAPGQPDYFQSPDNPARILPVDPSQRVRVPPFEFTQQLRHRSHLKLCPQRGVCRRRLVEALEKRLEIKSCAPA